MRKLTLLLSFIIGLFLTSGASWADDHKIVALVNGSVISSEDIQNRINAFLLTTKIPYNSQTKGMIKQRVINSAIDEKIKIQAAEQNGINITPEEVNASLRNFEKNHHIPMGQLQNILKQANVTTETFSEQMKSDLAWIRLIRKKYYAEGTPTQREIESALNEAKKDLTTPKFLVSEIYIKKDNARNLSDLVYNLRRDDRFDLYAMQFSDSPSAANGGNLGWVNEGKLPSVLEANLKKMKPGNISNPLMVGDGYYILKLQKTFNPEKDKQEIPSQEEIKTFIENQKMETLSKKLLQNLRQRAVIEMRS